MKIDEEEGEKYPKLEVEHEICLAEKSPTLSDENVGLKEGTLMTLWNSISKEDLRIS